MSGKEMGKNMRSSGVVGQRHGRKRVNCEVLMSHGGESWTSQLDDISSTGLRVERPFKWKGCPDDLYALDLMFGDDLHIHLEATVARIMRASLGFAFALVQSAIVLILLAVFGTDNRRPVSMASVIFANAVTTALLSPALFQLAQRLRQGGISRAPTEGAS